MKKNLIAIIAMTVLVFSLTQSCQTASSGSGNDFETNSFENNFDIGELKPFNDVTAGVLVSGIKIGWNLGNTLDGAGSETAWGNPRTTKENIDAIKKAGFNAIRIPVSWTNGIDGKYNIKNGLMTRVKEVVDYAVSNDMYIILNTHHDERIFKLGNKDIDRTKKVIQKIWMQIAYVFQNYNEKLIFEDLNEPRTKASPEEWSGGTSAERNNLNELHQIFVETVRASGGNNDKRILMMPAYAASATTDALYGLKIPNDSANNKIIVSVHAYAPHNFALNEGAGAVKTWSKDNLSDTSAVNIPIDQANAIFALKGIPVIMGEFGTLNRNNEDARAEHAEYYVSYAKDKGIKCFWWDDGGNFVIFNRRSNSFRFPKILDGLMKGAE